MYDMSLTDVFVNRDYEGEINAVGSVLNILNLARISEKTYTGANLSVDSLFENNSQLKIDQWKSFYWQEKTIDNWQSYIKNPHSTVVTQKADERSRNMDLFVFGLYAKVGAGNRVGTDYTAGTVSIDAAGNVTGTTTTFTAAMVGRGFKAAGHTKWYRVATYVSGTSITIVDDLDDVTAAYTGGVIAGGATYVIEAVTPISVTTSNLVQQIAALKLKLDSAEKNGYNAVPDSGRNLVLPPEFESVVVRASGVVLHVQEVYDDLIQKGMIGELLGFKLFKSNRLSGDNTNGYHCIGAHPLWMTFAEKLLEADIEEVIIGNFGTAYKDLFVYGAKVADPRRHFAAELFATFAI
jgi:hypothetical protein